MSKLTNTLDAAEEALYDAVKLYDQYRYDRAYDEDFIAPRGIWNCTTPPAPASYYIFPLYVGQRIAQRAHTLGYGG